MRDDVLRELYFGRIAPWEKRIPNSTEIRRLYDRLDQYSNQLQEQLSESGKKLMTNFLEARSGLALSLEAEAFTAGFTLGAKIIQAVDENKHYIGGLRNE